MNHSSDITRFIEHAQRMLPNGAWVLQIGAADGRYVDPVYPLLQIRPDLHLLAVEPVPWLFERLTDTYKGNPNVRLLNVAVARTPGPVEIVCHSPVAADGAPDWVIGLGTQLPIRNRLSEFGDRVETVTATGVRLADLIAPCRALRMDALVIDIEGYEPDVLDQLADLPTLPRLIMYEHDCVPTDGMRRLRSIAGSLRYRTTVGRTNTILHLTIGGAL